MDQNNGGFEQEPQQQMPPAQQYYRQAIENMNHPLTVGEWLLNIILASIPLVGFILLLVWAFDSNTNIHKSTWAKAMLVAFVAGLIIMIVFYTAFFSAILSLIP